MSKHAHFAAVDICNRFATHYMDVSANAGPWGTKHLEDVTTIIQEAIDNAILGKPPMTHKARKPNPHAAARHLDRLKELRNEHSRQFMNEDYTSMQTLTEKIKEAWAAYDFSCHCSFQSRKCFNCCAKPDEQFTVNNSQFSPSEHLPMLFCSAACRMEFGVSLGLT